MKQLKIFTPIESWFTGIVELFLEGLEKDEPFEVLISSPGGDAMAGISAFNMLKPYQPTVKVFGHMSSAASVVAMSAGEGKLIVAEGTLALLHGANGLAKGDAKHLRKVADFYDKVTESSLKAYMTRFNGTEQELKAILEIDEFHTAEQLKKWGLVDKILPVDDVANAEMFAEAIEWIENPKALMQSPDNFLKNYMTRMQSAELRPKETNIINNQNEVDMSMNADMQARYNEEFAKNATLSAQLQAKEKEVNEFNVKMTALSENLATMTTEKAELDAKMTATVTELDAAKVELSNIAKSNAENEIEVFLTANAKKFVPAQKDGFKLMLQASMNAGEDQYKLAKESIEKMPENAIYTGVDTNGRAESENATMTVDELKKVNWNSMELLSGDGQAQFTNAVNILMKADANLTSEQAENQLLGGQ